MLIAPGKDSNDRSKRLEVPCYSKGSRRARVVWLGVVKSLTEAQWHTKESSEVAKMEAGPGLAPGQRKFRTGP